MSYAIPDARELPHWLKPSSPTQAMAELMIRHRAALAEARAETDAAMSQAGQLVVSIGLALYRKRRAPNAAVFRTLEDALEAAGGQLITHVGEPFTGELEDLADVIDWVAAAPDISAGCVADAFEPEIRLNGRLVHRAKLVVVVEEPIPDVGRASESHIETTAEEASVRGEQP